MEHKPILVAQFYDIVNFKQLPFSPQILVPEFWKPEMQYLFEEIETCESFIKAQVLNSLPFMKLHFWHCASFSHTVAHCIAFSDVCASMSPSKYSVPSNSQSEMYLGKLQIVEAANSWIVVIKI